MSCRIPLCLSLAAPMVLLSQAAFADLTPQDVWGDWQQYMQGMGYQISATEAESGGNLTVSKIDLSFEMPDDAGTMGMALGTILFNQNRDGSVAIVMPDDLPITLTGIEGGNGPGKMSMSMNYSQTGQSLIASGDPTNITYDYNAATIALVLNQLQVGPDSFGQENARINMTGTGVSSSTTMTIGETRGYVQTGGIQALTYDIYIDNPEEVAKVGLKGSVSGVAFNGAGTIPLSIPNTGDMAAMMAAGFDVEGDFTYGAGATEMDVKDEVNGNFAMATSSQGGALGVKMGADGLAYTGSQNNLAMTVNAANLPFPVEINMARGGFNLAMPVTKSDDPQDFAFGITLDQFTMSDMIWSIFDPAGQLPRDPATVIVDLAGKAKLLVDYMNPEAAAQMAGTQPAEMQSLTLNSLILDAAGARMTGSGAATFDGDGPAMVPGLGNPVGSIDLTLDGGNALVDKLVAMGLLPQEQAMGARMMMGLFAVPGDGPDSLKSKMEMTKDGQILANGQRIR